MVKIFELNCEKENKIATISFDVIDCSTLNEKAFQLGCISKCSIVKNICKNCSYNKLFGQKIDI